MSVNATRSPHKVMHRTARLSLCVAICAFALTAAVPNYTSTTPVSADSARTRQVETAAALGMGVTDTIWLPGNVPMEFRICPAGWFRMGSPDDEDGHEYDERLVRAIITQPFYLSTFAMTQEQYRAVMNALPTGTSNYQANYTARISPSQILNQLIPAMMVYAPPTWEFRMVTRTQMEYTTRAGTQTIWYTGTDLAGFATSAWYDGNSGGVEHPVGQKIPNAWGFYDMLGNVWQWVDNGGLVKGGDYRSSAGGNGCRSSNIMIQDIPSAFRVVLGSTLNLMTGTRPGGTVRQKQQGMRVVAGSAGSIGISGLNNAAPAGIRLATLSGKVIRSSTVTASRSCRLNTNGVPAGTYVLQVMQAGNRLEQTVIVR